MSSSKPKTDPKKKAETNDHDQKSNRQGFSLEEDDEFEDFPAEDWQDGDTEAPGGKANLWEESWDDDDTSEDFSGQLKQELKKVEGK